VRAVVFEQTGEPAHVLSLQDIPAPEPGPGEVIVHVDRSVVQPADFMFVRGRYRIRPSFPQVAGLEGTGLVVDGGAESIIATGTRVSFRHPGAWAERVAVPTERCFAVPEGVPADAAAQFALNPVTAWALLDEAHVEGGDWIVLSAARSAVARLVAGIAGQRGVHVLGLSRPGRGEALDYPVLDSSGQDLAARIDTLTGGTLLAGFLDSVGGAVVSAVLPTLRPGATIVSYGVLDDAPIAVRNSDLIYRNLTWKGFGIDHWLATATHRRDIMTTELWRLLRDGALDVPVAARYPLDDIRSAVVAASTSPPGAKVLVIVEGDGGRRRAG
jgi:NADPH:quinone reductase-like Zn-dependent oxidoreductase